MPSVMILEAKPRRVKHKKQFSSMMHKGHRCHMIEKFKIKKSKRYKTGKKLGRNLGSW